MNVMSCTRTGGGDPEVANFIQSKTNVVPAQAGVILFWKKIINYAFSCTRTSGGDPMVSFN